MSYATVLKDNLLFVTMRRFTEQQMWLAIELLQGGRAQAYAARRLRMSQSAMKSLETDQKYS